MNTDNRIAIRCDKPESPQVFLDQQPLYSQHHAIERCEKKIASLRMEPHSCIVIFSPLLWLGIDLLLERCNASHCVVFIELEPLLIQVAEKYMPHSLKQAMQKHPHRYTLLWNSQHHAVDNNKNSLQQYDRVFLQRLSEILRQNNVSHIEFCSLSGSYRLHAMRYRTLRESVEKSIVHTIYNRQTLHHMGRLWIRNLLKNLVLSTTTHDWKELSTEWPIVVVGAGCSIDDDIQWLKQIASQVVIVAVDTAAIVLQQHQVLCDIVVVADAQIYNSYDMIGLDTANTIVIADLFANPSIHHIVDSDRLYWYCSDISSLMLLPFLRERNLLPSTIPPLGSVGVIAVYLALHISTNSVFSIGLDCSYTIGKTHARGAPMIQYFTAATHYLQIDSIDNYTIDGLLRLDNDYIDIDREHSGRLEIRNPSMSMYESHIAQLSSQYPRYIDCSNNRLNKHTNHRLPDRNVIDRASQSNPKHTINHATERSVNHPQLHKLRSQFIYHLYQHLVDKRFAESENRFTATERRSAVTSDFPASKVATTIDTSVLINMLSIDYHTQTDGMSQELLQHCYYSALDYQRRIAKIIAKQSSDARYS